MAEIEVVDDTEAKEPRDPQWGDVEDAAAEGTISGYKMALVEAEKVLVRALDEAGYTGATTEDKLGKASAVLSEMHGLQRARQHFRDIMHSKSYNLTSMQVDESLHYYRLAVQDVERAKRLPGWLNRYLRHVSFYVVPKIAWSVRRAIVALVLASLVILLLADTSVGRGIVEAVVSSVEFFYRWILFLLLVVGGAALVIGFAVLHWSRRKNYEIERPTEHKKE
jgi:hypothetical protein